MALAAFLGSESKVGYEDKNALGLPLPANAVSYKVLADDIEDIFNRIVSSRNIEITTRRKLITTALHVFGPRLRLISPDNSKNLKVGPFTTRFLNETYNFIMNDVERGISIHSWADLLDGPDLDLSVINVVRNDQERDVKTYQFGVKREYTKLAPKNPVSGYPADYLCAWLCKPNGAMDLMYTLQYCYGKRSLVEKQDVDPAE